MNDMTASFILRADASQARRELGSAGKAVREMGAASASASRGIDAQAQASSRSSVALRAQQQAAELGIGAMTRLTKVAAGAGAALGAALTSRALASAADDWSDMSSRIGAAVGDMAAAPALMQDMLRLANASYSSVSQTVEMFAGNVSAMRDLGYATQATLDFTESLNHMLVITATKGEQAASVQHALSKAMAVGKLDAEGLQTVLAHGGRVAEALAAELGVTVSQLRDLASQGKITGDVIARSIIGALDDVREQAGEMPSTIGDGLLKVGNSVGALVGVLDQAFGISGALAERLDKLSMGIGKLAAADFSGLMDSMSSGAQTLGQVLMVLAATRVPALITSVASLNITTALMNAGFVTGTISARAMGIAMTAQAAAARGLGAALAFAGGPMGLLAAGAAALALTVYNLRRESVDLGAALGEVRAGQDSVNDAFETFYRERTPEALAAMVTLAEAEDAHAQSVLAAARERFAYFDDMAERVRTVNEAMNIRSVEPIEMTKARSEMEAAERAATASATALDRAQKTAVGFVEAAGKAADGVGKLTDAQIKAESAARRQLSQLQSQAQINALIARHGEQSLSVTIARYAAERRVFTAQVASLDVSEDLKAQLIKAWDAANGIARTNMAGGIYAAAGAADALWGKLQGVLGTMNSIAGEIGRIGFDTVAIQAETAALQAGKSQAEAQIDGRLAQQRKQLEATRAPGWVVDATMKAKEIAEYAHLAEVEKRDGLLASLTPGRSGGGVGGGRSGAPKAERNAMAELIAEQRRQIAALRETDPIQREVMANHEALAKATATETSELRGLIEERQRLETIRSITEDIGETGRQAFSDLSKGAASLSDALVSVLDRLADIAASTVWDMFWGGVGDSDGLSGIVSGLVGSIMGAPKKADGGMIHGPGGPRDDQVLTWTSNGEYVVNAAATAANRGLVEAINAGARPEQLLALLAGSRAPRLASGGMIGSRPPARLPAQGAAATSASSTPGAVVNIINRSPEPIREERGSGPDLEGTVTLVVGRAEARGKFDRTRRGRFGLTPEVSRR